MSTSSTQMRSQAPAPATAPPAGPGAPLDPAQAAIAQPLVFALTPGQHHPDQYINYGMSQGLKLWHATTEPLPEEFDGMSDTVKIFCELLTQHATEAGWHAGAGDILTIPDANGVNRNLIMHYGQLTLQDV